MAAPAGVVRVGEGRPVTVVAAGQGATVPHTQRLMAGVAGTRILFEYGQVAAHLLPAGGPARRQADRDADELAAIADACGATRAIGVSRGARAVLGVLARQPDRFDRIALVWPPGGHAAGRYADWLTTLTDHGPGTPARVAVIARPGDRAHPLRVAQHWAALLAAHLDVHHQPAGALADFMNA